MKLKILINNIEYETERLPNGKFKKPVICKKYNGMKYSIAPLKQTNETIMVFQKPYKTGSCMHDVLAMENGDNTITCGALDIENNRIETNDNLNGGTYSKGEKDKNNFFSGLNNNTGKEFEKPTGRFPSQAFVNDEAAKHLDLQSGVRHTGARKLDNNLDTDSDGYNKSKRAFGKIKALAQETQASSGGCSKILHKCDYELERFDIYTYCPKVSNEERGNFNDHPTVKPLKLLQRILKYFKTPNKQIVLDSFVGSGSIPIAAINEGYDYIGTELNADYYEIAQKRIFEAQRQTKLF